ncbi:MAG TPA: hypothetical protein VGQ53_19080 [Chitinophagaceae bacterium]|jgi:hypothetical protein|nr:hypothetical protein [Chitinophagaceae bacterium]
MRILNVLALFVGISIFSFSQTVDYTIPPGFEKEINRDDYKKIVDRSVAEISKRYAIDNIKEGTVYLKKTRNCKLLTLVI